MTTNTNARTGLREGLHEYYNAPIVYQRGLGSLRFGGQITAVHQVPIANGLTLDFFARLGASDELLVNFHGALMPDKHTYPRFERVASLRGMSRSMMAFADPTIIMDPERKIVSAWFLGGPAFDPLPLIIRTIQKAMGKSGAKYVAFVGGSGGGYAALRASAMVPGSLAYVQDPQTNLAVHHPTNVDRYFSTIWPGWDQSALLHALPERFDMVRHYKAAQPKNFVYYAQNLTDKAHMERHFSPFLEAHGMKNGMSTNSAKNRLFAAYKGEFSGHGKITSNEFRYHFDQAMAFWRANRA